MSAPIEHPLVALALGDDGEIIERVAINFVYDRRDPWAVSLRFPPEEDGPVVWTVARCLLSEGLNQTTGDGDFRVTPADGMVRLQLTNGNGAAGFAVDIDELEEFVLAAFALVPEGTERRHVDLEALVRELLGGVR